MLLRQPLCLIVAASLSLVACGSAGSGSGGATSSCSDQNGGCDSHATCDDSSGQVVCTCDADAGFAGNGTACAYDPCLIDNGGCGTAVSCTDNGGLAVCDCEPGTTHCPQGQFVLPATSGTLDEPFDVTIDGDGTNGVGAVHIDGDVGTIEIEGTSLPVVAYEQIPFAAADETLYQLLAVATDHWVVGWAYCNGGMLNQVWFETTNGVPVTYEMATGTCTATPAETSAQVSFPAVKMVPPLLVSGYTITGADLSYADAMPGSMTLADAWDIYPFNTVDCSTGCGTPGWYELHSLLWDPSSGDACFGIFYLVEGMTNQVQLEYTLCLPHLDDPTDGRAVFDSTWSG